MSLFRLGRTVFRSVVRSLQLLKQEPVSASKVPWSVQNTYKAVVLHKHGKTDYINQSQRSGYVWSFFARSVAQGLASTQSKLGIEYRSFLTGHRVFRLLRRGEVHGPIFAFLGFVCTDITPRSSSPKHVEKDLSNVYQWIQKDIGQSLTEKARCEYQCEEHNDLTFKDYTIEHRLGKDSSNGAVYAATRNGDDKKYAIKMLFNFCTNSNSADIEKAFAKERDVLSLNPRQDRDSKYINIPPHPNILPVVHSFVDDVPCLPDAKQSYPAALPQKYTPNGMGRNKTMFLVTPRLTCTVQYYLQSHTPSEKTSTLLLVQLLGGITHLVDNGVAQRDMKLDNLLVDTTVPGPCPRLVICDFDCCLAEKCLGLKIPFVTEEIDRGGNVMLMPPEIITAHCGESAVLDYSKTDGWSAGAMAYELFGQTNPFGQRGLNSVCYQLENLPKLYRAPVVVRWVVKHLLCRNMQERLSARDAFVILSTYLFVPRWWLRDQILLTQGEILRWLLKQASSILREMRKNEHLSDVETMLKMCFVSRSGVQEVSNAVARIRLLEQNYDSSSH